MEGKNVVYLVALIVTCLFVILVLAYIPNLKDAFQNADQSSNLITNIENNINTEQSNDSFQDKPVVKSLFKQQVQSEIIATVSPPPYTIQKRTPKIK